MARGSDAKGRAGDARAAYLKGALDLLVLEVLRGGELHGYAIARAVRERSAEEILLEEGTLYPALHRMEARGWLRASWGVSENGRRARYYALSDAGRRERTARARSWGRFSAAVARVLEPPPAPQADGGAT